MRVLVCGGRDFNDRQKLHNALDAIVPRTEPDEYGNSLPDNVTIIHGGARGADQLADDYGVLNWCGIEIFRADWGLGKAAGPIRNQRMINEGKPDIVVAFPGGKGTADMVRRAKTAGIPVREIPPLPAIGDRAPDAPTP
ncbi:MAG: DUF2493 domain-containing protein [Mesorhizobium sp.]